MNILIVEDEIISARRLEKLLRERESLASASIKIQKSLTASECHLEENPVDLLFLDLNLNGEDGFHLLRSVVADSFQTIVVSGNVDRALEAYEYGVLDFLPKPVTRERLNLALDRFSTRRESGDSEMKYISLKKEDGVSLLPLDSVTYFQADDNYIKIHTDRGAVETHRKTLDAMEKILPARFFRIHRSYLVDVRFIRKLGSPGPGRYEATLQDATTLPVSRHRYGELRQRLEEL